MLKTGEERIIAAKVSRPHPPAYVVSFFLAYIVPMPDEWLWRWRVVQGDGAGGKGFEINPSPHSPHRPLSILFLHFFLAPRLVFHYLSLHSARISVYLACLSRGGLVFPRGGANRFTPARRPCLL